MLPHLLEILLVGQEAIQSHYLPVQIILMFNGSLLDFKQWGLLTTNNTGNIVFPLSFSSFCAIVIGTESAYVSGVAESWTTYWSQNLQGFTCAPYNATYNAGKSFIAVGK